MDSIKSAIREIGRQRPLITMNLDVLDVTDVSFGFRRLTLHGHEIDEYSDPRAADAFKVMIPPLDALDRRSHAPVRDAQGLPTWPGQQDPLLRALTVRSLDRARRLMTVDVSSHSDGLLNLWLSALSPGDTVSISGMRAEWYLPAEIEQLVLIADDAGAPALASIIEALPTETASTHTHIIAPESTRDYLGAAGTEGSNSAVTFVPSLTDLKAEGIVGNGARSQVWIAAETSTVRTLRSVAKYDWNVNTQDLLARAYWHRGLSGTDVDARDLERYRKALDEGADMHSPQLAEDISLND
ncbi:MULTISPECIES: siderophore-interacting protein [unclassified Brevibacterium]|uniref:siderophore-interacting protein n=1 Tax=unclassified Brevibacterium TaxID=2614124 RepID=UPI001093050F|nr:siderophore-interacting protein [Brevibacterium sp. S22]